MIRRWEFIKGFNEYMITDKGEVFRKSLIKPCSSGTSGYQIVTLCQNGKKKTTTIHSLVLAAFGPPKPDDCVAHHVDGNPSNNTIENLKWLTRSEHGKLHPRRKGGKRNMAGIACDAPWRGSRVHTAKLTDKKVREIRELWKNKTKNHDMLALSKLYGVTVPTICKIVNHKTWRHVI